LQQSKIVVTSFYILIITLWNKSQIANRKSINDNWNRILGWVVDVYLLLRNKLETRGIASLPLILVMVMVVNISYAQGNLGIELRSKTYVGNYNLSCNGGDNGEIDVLITGGTSPYTLVWNNNSTANPLLNLTAGTYTVTVTDAANATAQASATLIQPPALGYNLEVSQFGEYNLQYFGSTLGTIKINSSGGTPSYQVVWSDNNTELIRDSLAAGTYSFVLTDANGCSMSGSKTLTQPAVLSGTATQLQAVSCFEGEDGKAQVTASGGIAPYSYFWDNGSFSSTPEDLRAGLHEVHITDDADNTLTLQVTITEPNAIDVQISKSNYPNNYNVSCYNCFNGTIDAVASGGTSPYTFEWIWQENSIGTTANLSNLGGGDYELIINDQNNCRYRGEVNLKEPERQDWGMSGNAGTDPATQFIGTTDSVDVVFKSNGAEQFRLSNNYTKISSGNLMIGDSLGIKGFIDSTGTKILHFGTRGPLEEGPFQILSAIYCGQSNSTINLFDQTIFVRPSGSSIDRPNLSLKADGNNALIEATDGNPFTPDYEPRLLLNYYCGNDIFAGNHQGGDFIANHRIGINNNGDFGSSGNFKFHVNGDAWIDGSLHIGNENSSNLKVSVEGVLLSKMIKLKQSDLWNDYVFYPEYELMPIDSLSSFVKHKQHLPGVPAASEIEGTYYSLGEMNQILLTKIEESYLYILQLEERIKCLENK
jgi:hypothetical protein